MMAHTATADDLKRAVHHHPAHSGTGALERLFTFAFSGLVCPQIWEDPEVDMAAIKLGPEHRIITIASGGCKVLSYLARQPESIVAVDLNPAHIALTRLKLTAEWSARLSGRAPARQQRAATGPSSTERPASR